MGLFRNEKVCFDEVSMQKFWDWFKNNQDGRIFEIVREISFRLQKISVEKYAAVCTLGHDPVEDRGTLTFWSRSRHQEACMKRLAELAPADIREKWIIKVL